MRGGDLVFVADSHLEGGDDEEISRFLRFLEARRQDTAVLYLVGDIFKIWLGSEKFTMRHQRSVVSVLRSLRDDGVRLVMVEGNREFFLGRFEGTAFDRVESRVATEVFAGLRFHVSHGDLVNTRDWPYRVFRRVTKSRPIWWLFNLMPGGAGVRFADRLEARLKSANLRHKRHFPTEQALAYGRRFVEQGYDVGVIGHLHTERTMEVGSSGGPSRTLYILPGWIETHRFLRFAPDGGGCYETFVDRATC
jgi:UDP-2,3-diacylglucosamine hydrolase